MTNAANAVARREARFEFSGQTDVAIERRHDRNPRMMSGRLLDLTVSGAKLETETPLPLEESITLYFRFGQMNLNFMVEAQVRWTRPAKDPHWWVGCAFTPKMPEEHLACLAGEGMLDRRREPRRKVCLAAMARWELAAEQEVAVRIDDFSSGGLRMLSPQPAVPGQRLLLTAGTGGQRLLIPTRCHWQVESSEGYLVGCSFVETNGFARLAEVAQAIEPPRPAAPRTRRSWFWPWR